MATRNVPTKQTEKVNGQASTRPKGSGDGNKGLGSNLQVSTETNRVDEPVVDGVVLSNEMGKEFSTSVELIPKSLSTSDQNECKKVVPDVVIFGEDLFKLLSKASSEKEGWLKSTKAFDTGRGCLVQVTTQQINVDLTYSIAEALTFVPGVKIRETIDVKGKVTGRTLTGVR